MAKTAVRPIHNKTRIMGGQCVFRHKGATDYVKLGSVISAEFTPNLTDIDVYSIERGTRELIGTYSSLKEGTIGLTLESWTEWTYQALFMSSKNYLTQDAGSDVVIVPDVAAGKVVRIPGFNLVLGEVTDTDTEEVEEETVVIAGETKLVEDTHFTFHKGTGLLEVIELPEGFSGTDLRVPVTRPAITVADKILDLGVMENNGVEGELSIINIVGDGNPGTESEAIFWNVNFKPNGAVPFLNVENANQATLNGRVLADSSKSSGKSYGQIRTFTAV